MQRIQTARTEQAPAAQIHTTASNPHSTFTIPITDVTMEQRHIPNVSIMSEEQLKHATSSNFIRAKILPETDEYYSKQSFKETIIKLGNAGINKETALYILRNTLTGFRNHSEKNLINPPTEEQVEQNAQKSKGLTDAKKERKCKQIIKYTQSNKIRKAIQKS